MSIRTLSNLAVQDIADESAAIHSGGAPTFVGTDINTGISSGPQQLFGNTTPAIGAVRLVNFTLASGLSFANNKLDRFALSGAGANERYEIRFYDDLGFTQEIARFSSFGNGSQLLAPIAQNRTSSVRIQRVA